MELFWKWSELIIAVKWSELIIAVKAGHVEHLNTMFDMTTLHCSDWSYCNRFQKHQPMYSMCVPLFLRTTLYIVITERTTRFSLSIPSNSCKQNSGLRHKSKSLVRWRLYRPSLPASRWDWCPAVRDQALDDSAWSNCRMWLHQKLASQTVGYSHRCTTRPSDKDNNTLR